MHPDRADLFSFCGKIVHRFVNRVADRTHGDNNPFGVGRPVIIVKAVFPAGLHLKLLQVVFDNTGKGIIEGVCALSLLKVDIGVLGGTPDDRMLRIERPVSELPDCLHVDEVD